ncbi:MAG: hypothetical protein P1U32_09040, partial [Legionellaceae bacterium]|nr:hypothetical protein [Legionellaceae bacterium]
HLHYIVWWPQAYLIKNLVLARTKTTTLEALRKKRARIHHRRKSDHAKGAHCEITQKIGFTVNSLWHVSNDPLNRPNRKL